MKNEPLNDLREILEASSASPFKDCTTELEDEKYPDGPVVVKGPQGEVRSIMPKAVWEAICREAERQRSAAKSETIIVVQKVTTIIADGCDPGRIARLVEAELAKRAGASA